MTKADKKRFAAIREMGCILSLHKSGETGTPCSVHHILTDRIPGRRNTHDKTIGLAPRYHQESPEAIHTMGREAWEKHHGITELELLEMTNRLIGA